MEELCTGTSSCDSRGDREGLKGTEDVAKVLGVLLYDKHGSISTEQE